MTLKHIYIHGQILYLDSNCWLCLGICRGMLSLRFTWKIILHQNIITRSCNIRITQVILFLHMKLWSSFTTSSSYPSPTRVDIRHPLLLSQSPVQSYKPPTTTTRRLFHHFFTVSSQLATFILIISPYGCCHFCGRNASLKKANKTQ